MKENNLIIICNDETKSPKERFTELDEYIGSIILEIFEKKGLPENYDMIINLTDTFIESADFSQATDEYIVEFIENELKKGMI